jgi:hypothetical protein
LQNKIFFNIKGINHYFVPHAGSEEHERTHQSGRMDVWAETSTSAIHPSTFFRFYLLLRKISPYDLSLKNALAVFRKTLSSCRSLVADDLLIISIDRLHEQDRLTLNERRLGKFPALYRTLSDGLPIRSHDEIHAFLEKGDGIL